MLCYIWRLGLGEGDSVVVQHHGQCTGEGGRQGLGRGVVVDLGAAQVGWEGAVDGWGLA